MLTIEQKERKELLELYNKVRTKHTKVAISKVYGCTKQNIDNLELKLIAGKTTPKGITKLTKALNELWGK